MSTGHSTLYYQGYSHTPHLHSYSRCTLKVGCSWGTYYQRCGSLLHSIHRVPKRLLHPDLSQVASPGGLAISPDMPPLMLPKECTPSSSYWMDFFSHTILAARSISLNPRQRCGPQVWRMVLWLKECREPPKTKE